MQNTRAKDGHLIKKDDFVFSYKEKSNPAGTNLDILSYCSYDIKGKGSSDSLCHPEQELMLFTINGNVDIVVDGKVFSLSYYDTMYVPKGSSYKFENKSSEPAFLLGCKAIAEEKYEPIYSNWEKFSKDEARIRHLKGKDVFIMLDVPEKADKFIAGYTIYEPNTRAWPAHNHTDQEEIYIFIKGAGSMEVYADEETKTFVHNVDELDAVAIPVLNYHPVFSQEQELHFIWCIAGERYWVGDKNKDFMKGDTATLTT